MIEVLVADDHAVVRRGLRQILSETEDIVVGGEAASADEVVRSVKERRWGVIVLDISLPGGNGIDLIADIRRERPEARVLILTVHPEEQYAVRAIKAGASGYLTKESASSQLVSAIRKVAGGGAFISSAVAEQLALGAMPGAEGPPHSTLSDREFQVLKLLVSGKTVSEIAEGLNLSVKTISTHKTRLMQKMNISSQADLIRYALTHRLLDDEQSP